MRLIISFFSPKGNFIRCHLVMIMLNFLYRWPYYLLHFMASLPLEMQWAHLQWIMKQEWDGAEWSNYILLGSLQDSFGTILMMVCITILFSILHAFISMICSLKWIVWVPFSNILSIGTYLLDLVYLPRLLLITVSLWQPSLRWKYVSYSVIFGL